MTTNDVPVAFAGSSASFVDVSATSSQSVDCVGRKTDCVLCNWCNRLHQHSYIVCDTKRMPNMLNTAEHTRPSSDVFQCMKVRPGH